MLASPAVTLATDDKQPQDENAYRFSEWMTSEPMILISAGLIFLICVVVFEWQAILDIIVEFFGG